MVQTVLLRWVLRRLVAQMAVAEVVLRRLAEMVLRRLVVQMAVAEVVAPLVQAIQVRLEAPTHRRLVLHRGLVHRLPSPCALVHRLHPRWCSLSLTSATFRNRKLLRRLNFRCDLLLIHLIDVTLQFVDWLYFF